MRLHIQNVKNLRDMAPLIQTLNSVPLVSALKEFGCTRHYLDRFPAECCWRMLQHQLTVVHHATVSERRRLEEMISELIAMKI